MLIVRSGLVAKALGFTLIAAGVAYVLGILAQGMPADHEPVAGVFLVAVAYRRLSSLIGEGWLGFWLLLTKKLEHWSFQDMKGYRVCGGF